MAPELYFFNAKFLRCLFSYFSRMRKFLKYLVETDIQTSSLWPKKPFANEPFAKDLVFVIYLTVKKYSLNLDHGYWIDLQLNKITTSFDF